MSDKRLNDLADEAIAEHTCRQASVGLDTAIALHLTVFEARATVQRLRAEADHIEDNS